MKNSFNKRKNLRVGLEAVINLSSLKNHTGFCGWLQDLSTLSCLTDAFLGIDIFDQPLRITSISLTLELKISTQNILIDFSIPVD